MLLPPSSVACMPSQWGFPPSGRSTIPSSSPRYSPSKGRAKVTTLPTFVSRGKVRTAGITRSSRESSLTVGARGRFHPQASPILTHSSFIWVAQARHLTNRWWRDCRRRSQLRHQHLHCRTGSPRLLRPGMGRSLLDQRGARSAYWLLPSPPSGGLCGPCLHGEGGGRAVLSLGLDVPADPLPGAVGPGLGSFSDEVGEACLS